MFSPKSFSTKTFSAKSFKFFGIVISQPERNTGGGMYRQALLDEEIRLQDQEVIFVIAASIAAINKLN